MADPLTYLRQRSGDSWLVDANNQRFFDLAEQTLQDLRSCQRADATLTVLLAERDPLTFLARFIAAAATQCHLFLANPDWATTEWQQVFAQVQPDLVWGQEAHAAATLCTPTHPLIHPSTHPLILIPTGGTSGKIRFVAHTWETLLASVAGFQQHFGVDRVNSFCVLPLYHVSGLMPFLRSFTSGGRLVVRSFKAMALGECRHIHPEDFFLSLVPTQLQRLLYPVASGDTALTDWLARFRTVLLGGAPAWPELLAAARRDRIRLAPTYGMTETASQIATMLPEAFLAGQVHAGKVLPHAQMRVCGPSGEALGPHQIGRITIQATSLALGYYDPSQPCLQPLSPFQPDDQGFFDADGNLHIVGRQSDKIITGGENVFPAEVEAAILATGLVQDVGVMGLSDRTWGQAITAIYVPIVADLSVLALQTALVGHLSKFKYPKHWIAVDQLPRNSQGKLNRSQLAAIATAWQHSTGAATALDRPATGDGSAWLDRCKHAV